MNGKIIKFEKRQVDLLRTEGGGSQELMGWALTGEELVARSDLLSKDFTEVLNVESYESRFSFLPKVLSIEYIPEAKAKTHQNRIIELFAVSRNNKQIGADKDNKIIITVDSENQTDEVLNRLKDYKRNTNVISSMRSINKLTPKVTKSKNQKDDYKLEFIGFDDPEIDRALMKNIRGYLTEKSIDFKFLDYGKQNRNLLVVKNVNFDDLEFVKELPIKTVGPMPRVKLEEDFKNMDEGLPFIKIEKKIGGKYPKIGLLDSGVEQNEITAGWVTRTDATEYIDSELDLGHGTFIAGLMLNSELGISDSYTSINGCEIVDVPIIGKVPITEDVLIENIRKGIEAHHQEVKIWNLSASVLTEIEDDTFSDFAKALDDIQEELDVLIIKSAGNDGSFYDNLPKGKIHSGAESVRAITVGSISKENDEFNFSKRGYPSPYSRTGRGPAHIIKPDVVHYGGDVFALKADDERNSRNDYEEISDVSLGPNYSKVIKVGTSFSTPKVARILSELDFLLRQNGEEFDSIFLKSLLIHFSGHHSNSNLLELEERIKKMGFGKPENATEILSPINHHEATLVLRDSISKGQYYDVMEFPFPESLIDENGYFKGIIKVTLVQDPITASLLGPEYIQSDINVKLGTYEKKKDRDTMTPTILNPIGKENQANLLLDSHYSKNKMRAQDNYFNNERFLINYGKKYHPIKKYSINLEELNKAPQRDYLSQDRIWYLLLEGLYRGYTESKAADEERGLSLDFSLIITIKDPNGEKNVYEDTIRALQANNFNYTEIDTEQVIFIESEGELGTE